MRRRMLMGKKEPITVTLYGADNDTITISEGSTTLQSVTLSGASRKATIANGEGTYTFKSANTSYSTTVAVVNGSSVNVGTTYTISITLKGANNDNIRIRRTGVSDKWVTLSGTSGSVSYSMVGQSSGSMAFYSSVSGYSVTATVSNGNTITLYPSTAIYWYGNTLGNSITLKHRVVYSSDGSSYTSSDLPHSYICKQNSNNIQIGFEASDWYTSYPASDDNIVINVGCDIPAWSTSDANHVIAEGSMSLNASCRQDEFVNSIGLNFNSFSYDASPTGIDILTDSNNNPMYFNRTSEWENSEYVNKVDMSVGKKTQTLSKYSGGKAFNVSFRISADHYKRITTSAKANMIVYAIY